MTIKNVICDIDGVLMHDNVAVPAAAEFLHRIIDKGMPLVLLTNYPSQTGQDLANRFAIARGRLEVPAPHRIQCGTIQVAVAAAFRQFLALHAAIDGHADPYLDGATNASA